MSAIGPGDGSAVRPDFLYGNGEPGFEFPGFLDPAESASIRAVPGERRNVAVAPANDRVIRLTSGRGIPGGVTASATLRYMSELPLTIHDSKHRPQH